MRVWGKDDHIAECVNRFFWNSERLNCMGGEFYFLKYLSSVNEVKFSASNKLVGVSKVKELNENR